MRPKRIHREDIKKRLRNLHIIDFIKDMIFILKYINQVNILKSKTEDPSISVVVFKEVKFFFL